MMPRPSRTGMIDVEAVLNETTRPSAEYDCEGIGGLLFRYNAIRESTQYVRDGTEYSSNISSDVTVETSQCLERDWQIDAAYDCVSERLMQYAQT